MIGSFSWNTVADAYWLTSALWYSSLFISVLGIVLAAQQIAVLQLIGQPPKKGAEKTADVRRYLPLMLSEVSQQAASRDLADESDGIGVWKPRWKMVFMWQCPTMFMSYSIIFFLSGLTILVCTPLFRGGHWKTGFNVSVYTYLLVQRKILMPWKVAIVYLAIEAISGGIFIFCSFWVYHYVDLDQSIEDTNESPIEGQAFSFSHY